MSERTQGKGASAPFFIYCKVTVVTERKGGAWQFRTMMWKRTRLYSILNFKCPYCHEGEFFVSHPYDLKHAGDLHKECNVCHRRYSIEPGFFYGAMYAAYALAVAWSVTLYVAMAVLWPSASILTQFLVITFGLVVMGPLLYALSKIVWANLFFGYRGIGPTEQELRSKQEARA